MPQKVIRKVNLNISSLITNTVGSAGELLQNAGSSTVNFNLANHIVKNNLNGNTGHPFPNTIKSLFDSANNTQVRIVGHPDDGGIQLTSTTGNPSNGNVSETGRRGFFIFDLGRKINPRKFQLTLGSSQPFIDDDECLNPSNPPPKGVRLRFSNDLTLLDHQGAVDADGKDLDESTSYKDNPFFTDVTVAAGVAPHTEINSSGVTSTVGDTSSFTQKVLTLDEDFFTTTVNNALDGYRFLIVEIRGTRYAYTFDIFDISLFEEVDPTDYSVEFDDSLLDLAGWKNLRYDGSKLTGQKINEYNRGDITYGKNPVIENKTTALYIVDSCIGAEQEEESLAFIEGHSYLRIKQILVIDETDNSVQIIDRESEDFNVFQRFITNDFPTGAKFNIRVIDDSIQNSLKTDYFVKFNKGFLFSAFEYIPVTSTEVRQRTAIVKNKDHYNASGTPIKQTGESGTVNGDQILNINVEEEGPIGVFSSPEVVFGNNLNSTVPTFGTNAIGDGTFLFDNGVFDSLSLHKILGAEIRTNHAINLFDTLDNSASRFNLLFRYGTFIGGQTSANKKPSTISGEPPVNNYSVSTHIPASDSLDYFAHNFYPDYSKSFVRKNKFTEQYIPDASKKRAGGSSLFYQLFENEETTDITFNPFRTDAPGGALIGAVPEIISASIDFAAKNNIEMHLTINNGNIDCAPGLNDERSISTFEVETTNFQTTSSIANFVRSEVDNGNERYDNQATQPPFWGTITDFQIVLKPHFLPTIPTFKDIFSACVVGTHDSNDTITIEGMRTRRMIELRDVYLRGGQGFFFDSISTGTLNKIPRIYGTNTLMETDFGNPVSDERLVRHEGNFNYTLSFLDKGPTIITDLDKDDELFDGIGEKGLLIVPDQLEIGIRDNIDFYLRKAGIIEKKTIKAPPRPERGR